jgi:hypothetical protein
MGGRRNGNQLFGKSKRIKHFGDRHIGQDITKIDVTGTGCKDLKHCNLTQNWVQQWFF